METKISREISGRNSRIKTLSWRIWAGAKTEAIGVVYAEVSPNFNTYVPEYTESPSKFSEAVTLLTWI
jgi:hypothetical protein